MEEIPLGAKKKNWTSGIGKGLFTSLFCIASRFVERSSPICSQSRMESRGETGREQAERQAMGNLAWCALTCLVARRWMRLGGGGRLGGSIKQDDEWLSSVKRSRWVVSSAAMTAQCDYERVGLSSCLPISTM